MAWPCKDLKDSHIKEVYMQTNPLDCLELHGEHFTKIYILQVGKPKSNEFYIAV